MHCFDYTYCAFVFLWLINLCFTLDIPFDAKDNPSTSALPIVHLPYGSWRAYKYDPYSDVYTFKNIRYAAPPVGELRFREPAPPSINTTIHDGSYGFNCITTGREQRRIRPNTGEDCLFLDVYVSGKALQSNRTKFPVILWIFGGGYLTGSKSQFIDGIPVIEAANGEIVFVAINYRLGAYGFLAGLTVEREGTPNAGFFDQIAALKWTRANIHLFGGDPDNVNVWGQSAGAGSIMHLMTAYGGKGVSLFKRALLQSPGFAPSVDRKGTSEYIFRELEREAGCAGKGIKCLQTVPSEIFDEAQSAILRKAPPGLSVFGPSADGNLVQNLPAVELSQGKFDRTVESVIVSHVLDEASMFIPKNISNKVVDDLISLTFATDTSVMNDLIKEYPSPEMSNGKFEDSSDRLRAIVEDSVFLCNTRYVIDAMKDRAYPMQYNRSPFVHGSDLLPLFSKLTMNSQEVVTDSHQNFVKFSQVYRAYLVSHARTGDPNSIHPANSSSPHVYWPKALTNADNDILQNTLKFNDTDICLAPDEAISKRRCDIWKRLFETLGSSDEVSPVISKSYHGGIAKFSLQYLWT